MFHWTQRSDAANPGSLRPFGFFASMRLATAAVGLKGGIRKLGV